MWINRRFTALSTMLLALLVLPPRARALDPNKTTSQYVHQVWQTDNGLPQNGVFAITQTRDGYLWLATEEGLARFDGVRFTVFNRNNTPDMKANFISSLREGRDGSLWAGSRYGGLLRFQDGAVTAYGSKDGLPQHTYVSSITEAPDGSIWLGFAGSQGGISRFKNDKFSHFTPRQGLSSYFVTAVRADKSGNLWVGTDSGVDKMTDARVRNYTLKDGLGDLLVGSITQTHDGAIWVGTGLSRVSRIEGDRIKTYSLSPNKDLGVVHAIVEDRDRNLWFGTEGGGLFRMHDGEITRFGASDGLSSDLVRSIFEDREGNLWVGTDGGGLNRFKDGKFTTFNTRDGLAEDYVWALGGDRAGAVWLATNNAGLSRFKNGKFTTFTMRDGLSQDVIRSVYESRDGSLWFGTLGGGLNRFKDGRFTALKKEDGLSSSFVVATLDDQRGNLWIGTRGGLDRLRDGRITQLSTKDGLSSNFVRSLGQSRDGSVWVGTDSGLNLYSEGRFTTFGLREGLSNDFIWSIYEDQSGTMWFGTQGGLSKYDEGKFTNYSVRDGLFDDEIFAILEDKHENFWMSSNNGISRVRKADLAAFDRNEISVIPAVSYGTADGMKSRECNGGFQYSGWKSADGKLWFATIKGVVVVDPENLKINEVAPIVKIERMVVDKEDVVASARQEIAAATRNAEFYYTALSLVSPERVRFKYMLEGFDKSWLDAGTRRVAYYTRIPAGRYRFRVIACNNDGVWNETGEGLSFGFAPRLHETVGFYVACVLAFVGAVVGAFRLRTRQVRARNRELHRLVDERTRLLDEERGKLAEANEQLASANDELQRLSLQDPLTEIANRRYFEMTIISELRRASRTAGAITLIRIDIDSFESYSGSYGRKMADDCLRKVARALQRSANRAGDVVARCEGEEFAVILPGVNAVGAAIVAERLRAAVEALRVVHLGPLENRVTISLGVATAHPRGDVSPARLLSVADEALERAKETGRNRSVEVEVLSVAHIPESGSTAG